MRPQETLWVEKYRPAKISDCVLPEQTKKLFQEIVDKGEMVNLLLSGSPGTGKTTVAKALCNELGLDYIFINGSENGNIDTLRTTIRNFASTVSLHGGMKVVILDEGDYLNPSSTQPALRSFIEEFSRNCRFIVTCNFKNKIIEPLHSRFNTIEFRFKGKDKPKLAALFLNRLKYILDTEKVKYDEAVLVEFIIKHFPDYRKIINQVQSYCQATGGNLDSGILANLKEINLKALVEAMKTKNFGDVRKWVANNADSDQSRIFREIYDGLYDYMNPKTIPLAIKTLADYQYKAAFVADAEINLSACIIELMMDCEFKA